MNRHLASKIFPSIALLALTTLPVTANETLNSAQTFKKKCTFCHAIDKKKRGPAVINMSNEAAVLRQTITNGRKFMPKFSGKLTPEEIDGLVSYLLTKQHVVK